jgi:predicted DCC family thiol-disulfide oxidoreductase YuxK
MISLSSDITDRKGRRARSGWVFFDADCAFCRDFARRFRRVLEARGFALAPLQAPRVQDLLALPAEQLLSEMRVLTAEGKQFGGADAVLFLCSKIWWVRPLWALAHVPGMPRLLGAAYRWVAAQRHSASATCAVMSSSERRADNNDRPDAVGVALQDHAQRRCTGENKGGYRI